MALRSLTPFSSFGCNPSTAQCVLDSESDAVAGLRRIVSKMSGSVMLYAVPFWRLTSVVSRERTDDLSL